MTIDDVRRKSLRGIKDVSTYTANYDFSDCVYDAIQELQTNSLCSRVEIRKKVGINGELSEIRVLDGGSGYTFPPTVVISDNLRVGARRFSQGVSQYGSLTQFSAGSSQTIEFWIRADAPTGGNFYAIFSDNGGSSTLSITETAITYSNGSSKSATHGGLGSDSDIQIIVRRSGTSVSFFKNSSQIGTTQTLAINDDFIIDWFGWFGGYPATSFVGDIYKVRIYSDVFDQNDIDYSWNGGYSNDPVPGLTLIGSWEMDGSGGTGATEADSSGNSRTMTFTGSPTVVSIATGESSATSKAVAEAIVEGGSVTSIVLTSTGIGYFSQPTITFSGGNGTNALAVAPILGTTFHKTITAKYSASTASEIPIECLYVDAVFKVDTNGTKIPVKLIDRYTVSAEKDLGIYYTNSENLRGAVLWNRGNIEIFTPWDMTNATLELWIRFQIPYTQDANVGTNANSYLDTIPVQFQNRLISGVKYHVYETMEELSGFSGKYKPMMDIFGNQWFNRDLPYVKQEVNSTKAAETVRYIKPATVSGL